MFLTYSTLLSAQTVKDFDYHHNDFELITRAICSYYFCLYFYFLLKLFPVFFRLPIYLFCFLSKRKSIMRVVGKTEFIVNLKQATFCLHFSRFHNRLSNTLSQHGIFNIVKYCLLGHFGQE